MDSRGNIPAVSPIDPVRISVIVPTYNRAHYLKAALNSVLHQTCPPHEVIVIDDGSTDETRAVVAAMAGPVRYMYQDNRGPAAARNLGLRAARGEWIAFNDSDDLWVSEKLQWQVEFLRRHPGVDFVFGPLSNFTGEIADGNPEVRDQYVVRYLRDHADNLTKSYEILLQDNPIPTPAVLFRRACLDTVGYFNEELRCCEDYEYWLRFAAYCRMGYLDKVLIHRRIHPQNLIHDYVFRHERHLQVLEQAAIPETLYSRRGRALLSQAIHKTRYRLGSFHFSKRKWNEADRYLSITQWLRLYPDVYAMLVFPVKRMVARWRVTTG